MKRFFAVLLTVLTLSLASIGLFACGNSGGGGAKVVPVFTGMTIGGAPSSPARTARAMRDGSEAEAEADTAADADNNTDADDTDAEAEVPEVTDEDNVFDEDIEEAVLPNISVETSDEVQSYAEKDTDIFINVHITNPSGYVILRFTLNGTIYQSYQFESGSDSELLILKVNTGSDCGIREYTIDAIKYIDDADNLNKDVDMTQAEKTIKVGVQYDAPPEATLGDVTASTEKAELSVELTDTYSLIAENKANIYLYDGKDVIKTVPLVKGDNAVTFDGLKENKTYQYVAVAVCDILDGEGEQKVTLGSGQFRTKAYYTLEKVTPTKDSVSFTYSDNAGENDVTFDCFALHDRLGKAVRMTDDINELAFANILSDTEYTVALYYSYTYNGEKVQCVNKLPAKTFAKATPTVELATSGITQTGFTFSAAVTDADGVGGITSVKLNNEAKELGDRTFTGLLSDNDYTVEVVYTYDLNDGKGSRTLTKTVTAKTLAKATPTVELATSGITQTGFTFSAAVTDADGVGGITSVKLNDTAKELDDRTFTELLSDNDYTVEVVYTYDLNDGKGSRTLTKTVTAKTLAKATPTVQIKNITSTRTTIDFDISTADADGLLTVKSVKLLDGSTTAGTAENAGHITFTGLSSGKLYKAEIEYSYDLNDGKGVHNEKAATDYPTLVESIAIEDIVLLNNNVVKSGEEINLRIYFINSSEIEMTDIYVNGQKTQVTGGDRVTSAIVKFVPKDIGLVEFAVSKVDYTYYGISVNQEIDSDVSVEYPIYSDISPTFEAVTASPYEYTAGGIYFEFDNKLGYNVYKINDSAEFVRLAGGAYYVYADCVSSVEYGYDHYGATTQTFTYSAPSPHYVTGFTEVSTAEQFFAMTDGYYILTADLDLRKETTPAQINLSGILYGGGHTVRGLSNVIDTSSVEYYSLFPDDGWNSGSIYDVKFTELYVSITATDSITINPLGAVGLYNCSVTGDVWGSAKTSYGTLNVFDSSCSYNINVNINGASSTQKVTAAKTIAKNSSVKIADGTVYYECGDGYRALAGYYDNTKTSFTDTTAFAVLSKAFALCTALTDIDLPENALYTGELGLADCKLVNAVVSVNDTEIIDKSVLKSITIVGKGEIHNGAFYDCNSLENVTIGNGVTSIDSYAFYGCSGLTSITIPDGVTSIGSYAFFGCSGLTSITIPDGVTSIGSYAFYGCSGLTSITIPDGVTNIGERTFYGCSELTSITIPDGVTSIGESAFAGCSKLTSVTIGNRVTSIGESAFWDCIGLTSVTIGNRVTSIGKDAFHGCSELTSITIPDGVKSIDSWTFAGCSKLTSIIIPDSVTSIGYSAFSWCSKLTSIIIPDSVTSVGESAFDYCGELKSVIIGRGVTSIGNHAFQGCGELTSLIIGSGVTSIGGNAFNSCGGLAEIVIPDSVKSIGDYAFNGCGKLTSLIIGSGVKEIGKGAFGVCAKLTDIYYKGTESDWSDISVGSDNDKLNSATRYYYSESDPYISDPSDTGKYWHYDNDGNVAVWEK